MDIIGRKVSHASWGEGTVIGIDKSILAVSFEIGEKRFSYPDAFRKFLSFVDEDAKSYIEAELKSIDEKKLASLTTAVSAPANPAPAVKKKAAARTDRPNIAFKCNFCDGGATKDSLGYQGVCSDEIIHYNIEVEHRTWCSSENCPCRQYHDGEMTRDELEEGTWDDAFTCYESKMLQDWVAKAGIIQNGDRKGQPMRLSNVSPNSLCILTTREPYSTEDDRFIFAVFLIDDTYDGDDLDEGFVSCRSKFRIALTPAEAHKMPFWRYHANSNNADVPAWNSGLHRYLTDMQAAQILWDIAKLKRGKTDHALAEEFLQEFCRMTKIAETEITEPSGALTL